MSVPKTDSYIIEQNYRSSWQLDSTVSLSIAWAHVLAGNCKHTSSRPNASSPWIGLVLCAIESFRSSYSSPSKYSAVTCRLFLSLTFVTLARCQSKRPVSSHFLMASNESTSGQRLSLEFQCSPWCVASELEYGNLLLLLSHLLEVNGLNVSFRCVSSVLGTLYMLIKAFC